MTQTLHIDPEFKAQIPPLTQDERKQLEENILAEGELLAPILVWNGTIVDGHNRYEILQSHPEIPCIVRNLELETRDEVLVWICKHQLGRRNLTPEQKKFLMGKQYDAEKQADGFHGNQHTRPVPSAGAQNEHKQTAEKTCERIARENHISASAVRRAALFAAGVDLAEELCPGIRRQVLSGDLKAPDALFERLAKARPADYDALLEQIKNPQSRAKPAAKQKLFQTEKSASSEPSLAPPPGERKSVLEETSSIYGQLANAVASMQESWETIFKQTPTLLTDSEQRKAVQAILEKHLAYLAALGFSLSEVLGSEQEQSA
ncbi:ParB N-terminal domain-containing protein [Faecalibacterium sp. An192]|uniref:ParB N-terminal domain-containing protein n=1 Tax=Faecalibacterium sp. An192 TaxID=1965581 RepID=UPI000B36A4E6|nr:ParB N-terminal domain-containing protein [Faecalibacterium sp. An192]OUP28541.1 hypothetical protein B5F27_06280 [Faecalibacterium sp. An192]